MTRTRWTGLAGVLFGIALFGTFLIAGSTPDSSGAGAADRFAKYWNNSDHQSKALAAAITLMFGCLLFIAFAAGLRDRLRTLDVGPLPSLVLAAGTAAAVLLTVGGLISLVVGVAANDSSSFKVDGSTGLLFDSLGYGVMAAGMMAAGVMTVTTGLLTLRTRILPAWTAWVGFLVGLAALGSAFTAWIDFMLLPVWAVLVGIAFLVRKDTRVGTAVPDQISVPA